MLNHTAQGQTRFGHLLAVYEAAFAQWSLRGPFLQALRWYSTPDSTAIQEARAQVEDAQVAYRDNRDLLADFMLVRLSNIKASCGRRTSASALTEIESTPAQDATQGAWTIDPRWN